MNGASVETVPKLTLFHHEIYKFNSRRGGRGLVITLPPKLLQFYKDTGGELLVHALEDGKNCIGRRYLKVYIKLKRDFRLKNAHLSKTKFTTRLARVHASSIN